MEASGSHRLIAFIPHGKLQVNVTVTPSHMVASEGAQSKLVTSKLVRVGSHSQAITEPRVLAGLPGTKG